MIYSSWDIEQNKLKLQILGHFLPFYPPKNLKKSKFWKMEKFAGDTIILHKCTKNHNHMMYSSRDTEWDRQYFLSFRTIFFAIPPPSPLSDTPLLTPQIWSATDRIFCHFGLFFALLPQTTQKIKMLKNWNNKKAWRYHFMQVHHKSWSYAILFLRYDAWRM